MPRNDTARTRNNTAAKASGPRTTPAAKWKSHNAHANVFGVSAKIAVHHSISRNTMFENKATRIMERGLNILIFSMPTAASAPSVRSRTSGWKPSAPTASSSTIQTQFYDESRTRARLAIIHLPSTSKQALLCLRRAITSSPENSMLHSFVLRKTARRHHSAMGLRRHSSQPA